MTVKLYYEDSFMKEFTASIVSTIENDGEYHVVLDRTAFYPEGGGQPSDKGTIGGEKAKYVYSKKGQIFHVMERLPSDRGEVDCELDWKRRFDHMQQHTGEHILSAVFKRGFNAENTGFHLGEDYVSIDLDLEISQEQVIRAEKEANDAIYNNLVIESIYPDREELKRYDLRKEPVVEDNIRIVKIGELDFSPCGGTHLSTTGQVGVIKIIGFGRHKGGSRVKFLCGQRALMDYGFKDEIAAGLRQTLAVQNKDITAEVGRLKDELDEKDRVISELNNKLLDYRAEELLDLAEDVNGIKVISKVFTSTDFNELKLTASRLTEEKKVIVIMGQRDDSAARLVLSRSEDIENINMNQMIKAPLKLIDGNGGGNEVTAQGGGSDQENIDKAVESAFQHIKEEIWNII